MSSNRKPAAGSAATSLPGTGPREKCRSSIRLPLARDCSRNSSETTQQEPAAMACLMVGWLSSSSLEHTRWVVLSLKSQLHSPPTDSMSLNQPKDDRFRKPTLQNTHPSKKDFLFTTLPSNADMIEQPTRRNPLLLQSGLPEKKIHHFKTDFCERTEVGEDNAKMYTSLPLSAMAKSALSVKSPLGQWKALLTFKWYTALMIGLSSDSTYFSAAGDFGLVRVCWNSQRRDVFSFGPLPCCQTDERTTVWTVEPSAGAWSSEWPGETPGFLFGALTSPRCCRIEDALARAIVRSVDVSSETSSADVALAVQVWGSSRGRMAALEAAACQSGGKQSAGCSTRRAQESGPHLSRPVRRPERVDAL